MSGKEAGTNALHEHGYEFNEYCAAHVCGCGHHKGLARCWCGWSVTDPGRGYQELIEMGETIGDEALESQVQVSLDEAEQDLLDEREK